MVDQLHFYSPSWTVKDNMAFRSNPDSSSRTIRFGDLDRIFGLSTNIILSILHPMIGHDNQYHHPDAGSSRLDLISEGLPLSPASSHPYIFSPFEIYVAISQPAFFLPLTTY